MSAVRIEAHNAQMVRKAILDYAFVDVDGERVVGIRAALHKLRQRSTVIADLCVALKDIIAYSSLGAAEAADCQSAGGVDAALELLRRLISKRADGAGGVDEVESLCSALLSNLSGTNTRLQCPVHYVIPMAASGQPCPCASNCWLCSMSAAAGASCSTMGEMDLLIEHGEYAATETASCVWDGAVAISCLLCRFPSIIFPANLSGNFRAVEIGCGPGLCSCVLLRILSSMIQNGCCPATSVHCVITDYEDKVLEKVRRNLISCIPCFSERQGGVGLASDDARILCNLQRMDVTALDTLGTVQFSLVIASEVLYDAKLVAALPVALERLLCPGGIAIVSYNPGRDRFAVDDLVATMHKLQLECLFAADGEALTRVLRPMEAHVPTSCHVLLFCKQCH